mmetsp:Transcript_15885/g.34451  ORF Transcript_15885/g.34451 Transcript_15885/m.34451 type:complete len:181 (-) Transcript_15885:203-745(-)|eukprot:CAMPEP_0118933044 /NCGR_PEP_ID=MMETSP1169-20130426/11088_1 /TAXON_ID=36882 /ORGANISM="Pyramimonas obovata, Strain CCMP722" /LENGTH=180 /DNA_ID=CAMNT_0006875763 /DNA_START=119 /DNA_END=661 /DNA_ORIENTATION=+
MLSRLGLTAWRGSVTASSAVSSSVLREGMLMAPLATSCARFGSTLSEMLKTRDGSDMVTNDPSVAPVLASGWVLNQAVEEPKKHEKTLRKIFQHPICTNVSWKEVEQLLDKGLGATLEPALVHRSGGGHKGVRVRLNGHSIVFDEKSHASPMKQKEVVINLRHFMEKAGVVERQHQASEE